MGFRIYSRFHLRNVGKEGSKELARYVIAQNRKELLKSGMRLQMVPVKEGLKEIWILELVSTGKDCSNTSLLPDVPRENMDRGDRSW
jgi:hypothetical protein